MAVFGLDADGALRARDDEARLALAGREGEFQLLPSSPDLLLFVRSVPTGGTAPQPRVVLAGDASGFPLADLLAFLAQSRWSGMLRVHQSDGRRSVWLKDGEVRGANSENVQDRLGEVMVRMGYIRRADLNAVLQSVPPSKIGRTMVDRGLLQSHDLYKCITQQVSDIFHAVVLSKEGPFALVEQPLDEKNTSGIQLSTQSLLMDSIRKVDELAHFRKRIPNNKLFVVKKRPSDGSLEPEEEQVLALVNGQLDIEALGQRSKLSEFDVLKVVHRLLELGFAQLNERPIDPGATAAGASGAEKSKAKPGSVTAGPGRDFQIVAHTFNEIFRKAFAAVQGVGKGSAFLQSANAALAQGGLTDSPIIRGLAFSPVGELSQQELWQRYDPVRESMGPKPLLVLKQALASVMYFLVFQASEVIDLEEGERLGQEAKLLLSTLDWV